MPPRPKFSDSGCENSIRNVSIGFNSDWNRSEDAARSSPEMSRPLAEREKTSFGSPLLHQFREIIVDVLPVTNEEYDNVIRGPVNLVDYSIITHPNLPES